MALSQSYKALFLGIFRIMPETLVLIGFMCDIVFVAVYYLGQFKTGVFTTDTCPYLSITYG